MCGIYWEIVSKESNARFSLDSDERLRNCLQCRGPDFNSSITKPISSGINGYNGLFYGTVLWMQGRSLAPQPLEDRTGILIYNGDMFDTSWDKNTSDTTLIMEKLHKNGESCKADRKGMILKIFSRFKGPFSIIYYDKILKLLFFARDALGRNSLLLYRNKDSCIISSVLSRKYKGSVEIPATDIFTLNFEDLTVSKHGRYTLEELNTCTIESWIATIQEQQSLPDDVYRDDRNEQMEPGLEDINIINFIESVSMDIKCRTELMTTLLKNNFIYSIVQRLTDLLKASVKVRLDSQPYKCKNCIKSDSECTGHCTVGVLFSGGLDCTIIALLADDYLPKDQPIDLINVAFKKGENDSFDVPDRLTGRLAARELEELRPARKWVFREVNVGEEELRREQESTIADLVHPRRTVLDESLGSALWFAARASDDDSTSPCRVLLLGSGADELFGGYTRHRNVLKRSSWSGLNRELQLDWQRISYRNLARDNRVIGHHGRQPRMPYLDEDFVQYVLQLKPWQRCVPSVSCGPGLGDKLFLRLTAFHLGLEQVSSLPKRALQFGSRIANKKENGADLSERFRNF